jgi:large subunit ribosomal protein L23
MKDLTLIPRVSEKAYAMSQVDGIKTYVFEVPTSSNKHSVARGITAQYDVVVTSVRTVSMKGKEKQMYRKGGRPVTAVRNNFKKAYITLREGDSLPLFVEEAAKEEKQAKVAEKVAKKAAKEKK